MCQIIGIEPQFENIISNGPYIPMAAGQRKPETQWTPKERKAANLDRRLKSLIMSVLPDDQINYVINCLTIKSTWDDLILYHEGPSDVKDSRVIDLKLPKKWLAFCQTFRNTNHVKEYEIASLFGKLKYEENLINNIYDTNKEKTLVPATPLSIAFFSTSIVQDSQDSSDDEEDTRSSQEYMNDLEEEYQVRALLAKSKRHTKDFEAKYNKVKAKLALLSSSASASSSFSGKNKVLIAESYDWDKEEVHTLLEMEDNDNRKSFLDYLCIDLNYVEKQRNNLLSKHRNLVQELNTCKEQLLVLKQAKLDLLTMQHVNTEILKENQNLRNELKELTSITEAWLNSSNKVNQCISEQIPTQKKKILGIDQLTKDTSSSGPKDLVFVKSSTDNSEESITGSNKSKLSEAEDSTLSNHDTSKTKDYQINFEEKSTFKAETLKGIIINGPSSAPARGNKGSSTYITNSAPAGKLKNMKMKDDPPLAIIMKELNELKLQISKNKSSYFISRSLNRPARPTIPFPSCIHYGYNDHKSDDYVYYPICEICGSYDHYDHDTHGHNRIISLGRGIKPRNPQHVTKNCETCGSNVHTTFDHNDIEWFRKREALQAKKVETFKASKTELSSALRSKTPTKRCLLVARRKLMCWSAKKKQSAAMSSAKAENVVAAGFCANILWMKSQLTD
ncbi:hypothetical protein Tco_0077817 [Tanacetum coccineum]